ncbi:MAG: hypothetical protein ACYTDY_00740 [Planctomycetota bacterium]|jgi:hypothetical protein
MNAPAILTNVAVLLVVGALWAGMRKSSQRGLLITAALLALASAIVQVTS